MADGATKRYRLYIDESGDNSTSGLASLSTRYLGICGVILPYSIHDLSAYQLLGDIKARHFSVHPDDSVILHREDICNHTGPFIQVKETAKQERFDADLLEWISCLPYTLVTVVLDKKQQMEQYGKHAWDSYLFGLVPMLERYVKWLNDRGFRGDVLAEKRGHKHDEQLKAAYKEFYANGSEFRGRAEAQEALAAAELKCRGKEANVAGLQLADLLAHPSTHQVLREKGLDGRPPAPFASKVCPIIESKYNRGPNGKVWGYGKILIDFKKK